MKNKNLFLNKFLFTHEVKNPNMHMGVKNFSWQRELDLKLWIKKESTVSWLSKCLFIFFFCFLLSPCILISILSPRAYSYFKCYYQFGCMNSLLLLSKY